MKKSGLIRMDEVGRIVLPKEIRKVLKLDKERLVELYIEKDKLIIKKYSPVQNHIVRAKKICETLAKQNNCICVICDTAKIVCVSGEALTNIVGKKISPELYSMVQGGAPVLINTIEGATPKSIVDGLEIEYYSLAAIPIEQEECPIGLVALVGTDKEISFSDCDVRLLKLAKDLIEASCITENEE